MVLEERLLQREEILLPACAIAIGAARINVEPVRLLDVDVVDIVNVKEPNGPIDRLESGLAFEDVEADLEIARDKKLLAPSEKLRAVRPRSAHAARHRQTARLELGEVR